MMYLVVFQTSMADSGRHVQDGGHGRIRPSARLALSSPQTLHPSPQNGTRGTGKETVRFPVSLGFSLCYRVSGCSPCHGVLGVWPRYGVLGFLRSSPFHGVPASPESIACHGNVQVQSLSRAFAGLVPVTGLSGSSPCHGIVRVARQGLSGSSPCHGIRPGPALVTVLSGSSPCHVIVGVQPLSRYCPGLALVTGLSGSSPCHGVVQVQPLSRDCPGLALVTGFLGSSGLVTITASLVHVRPGSNFWTSNQKKE